MADFKYKIGFNYFSSPAYLVNKQVRAWMPALHRLGASFVIFQSNFDRAIPEDVFLAAEENDLEPVVHFSSELPLARKFNDISILLNVYARWGAKKIIFGERPNTRKAWPTSGWHYENLVDHFLDRFIPLANHAVRIGLSPVMPPLQPGGDYWDMAFIELALSGMKRRRMDDVLKNLILSSYGYTFNKSLTWGKGGPEQWSVSKPYFTPDGQEDQLGFHNFEWVQATGERTTGKEIPVMILNAGHAGTTFSQPNPANTIESIQRILLACSGKQSPAGDELEGPALNSAVAGCAFSLDTLETALEGHLSFDVLQQIFGSSQNSQEKTHIAGEGDKIFAHYLLLPSHISGVSDVVLNKVRPLIKKFTPTVGFSLEEAALARKVSVFPDPIVFTEDKLNDLRAAGCLVEVLPNSGIEIATMLQGS